MKLPRISLVDSMLAILLIAIDLACVRAIGNADATGNVGWEFFLPLSVLPMVNALAACGHRWSRNARWRRPFTGGFLRGGLAAMLVHCAFHRTFPALIFRFYRSPGLVFWGSYEYCRDYLPASLGQYGSSPLIGFSYILFCSVFLSMPQFLVAGLCGLNAAGLVKATAGGAPA